MRDQDPPAHIRDFDVALGDHLQSKDDLLLEEVHDSVRGHQDIAVDEEGNVTDQPLLDYQHHIHGSVADPLYPPHLKREAWADMVDEAGDIPVETINYPGGIVQFHPDLPDRSKRMHDLVHGESTGGVVESELPDSAPEARKFPLRRGQESMCHLKR